VANIRRASAEEAGDLSELALRSKAYWGYDTEFLTRCRDELTLDAEQIEANPTFLIEEQGALLGFYAVQQIASDRMELSFLFVEPTAIRRGHGRTLIEHAKRRVREAGFRILEIQGDPHAADFYYSAGARLVGSRVSASILERVLPVFEIDLRDTRPKPCARGTNE
jgi:N-acetylglutamate synthase-like GNAT family acetyltransferase